MSNSVNFIDGFNHTIPSFDSGNLYRFFSQNLGTSMVMSSHLVSSMVRSLEGKVLFVDPLNTKDDSIAKIIESVSFVSIKHFDDNISESDKTLLLDAFVKVDDVLLVSNAVHPSVHAGAAYLHSLCKDNDVAAIVMNGLPFLHSSVNIYDRSLKVLAKELNVPIITFELFADCFNVNAPASDWSDVDSILSFANDDEDGHSLMLGFVVKNTQTNQVSEFDFFITESNHVLSLKTIELDFEVVG
jgi:hypothetical protein